MRKNAVIYISLLFFIIVFIYLSWFDLTKTLSSGDWPYLFLQNIQEFKVPTELPFLWLEPYYQITAKLGVQILGLSWEMTEKIFWFFPFLAISLASSYFLLKYLSKKFKMDGEESGIFISLGCLIFTTNTYILMLVGGGQMGVAMAYSLIPLILRTAFKIYEGKISFKKIVLYSLTFGIQMMFDPRLFLLSIFVAFLYFLFSYRNISLKVLKRTILILVLATAVNLFWILPNLNFFSMEYAAAINALTASYLSFAAFSNSITLFHPNWPENIFGKIGFMKPEFIVVAVIAFVSLFFANKNKSILFFAGLGIFGAFFAKGTNPPFGELYTWLSSIPGFMIFRDPTKFYVLMVVSYMVMLPFSVLSIVSWVNSKLKTKNAKLQFKIKNLLLFLFIGYWLFLIRPAILGDLSGTFKPRVVPEEYVNLKNFMNAKPEFTKTLWVPVIGRFGFGSESKPAISAMELFGVSSVSGTLDKLDDPGVKKQLMDEEIKYIIIPDDYLKEIFLTDREYDEKLYKVTVDKLKNVTWLSELKNNNFGKIKVFEISKF